MISTVMQRMLLAHCFLVFSMNANSGLYIQECKLKAVVFDLHVNEKTVDIRQKISIEITHTETIESTYGDHPDNCKYYPDNKTILAEFNSMKLLSQISVGDVIEIDHIYSSSRSHLYEKWFVVDILFSDKTSRKH